MRLLLSLLLCGERSIHLQQAFGQLHAHLPVRRIHGVQKRLSERHIQFLASMVRHDQERRFASSKLNIFDASNLAPVVEHRTTNQVAHIIPARLKLGSFAAGNLQLATEQFFRLGNRIDARELQYEQPFVRPQVFYLKLADVQLADVQLAAKTGGNFARTCGFAGILFHTRRQSPQPHANRKTPGNIAVNLSRDFTPPSLRLYYAGQGNEFPACFRIHREFQNLQISRSSLDLLSSWFLRADYSITSYSITSSVYRL